MSMNNSLHNTNNKKDKILQTFINIGTVICFFVVVIIIYKLFIKADYSKLIKEGFYSKENKDTFINTNDTPDTTDTTNSSEPNTIYETSIINIYGENKRLICSMIPTIDKNSNICKVDNKAYITYKFPIHLLKLIDDSIIAVFNDGRLYKKISMESTIWEGPLQNSMPQGTIPLRMVTLSTDLNTLFGVGYDNVLYVKKPKTEDQGGGMNLLSKWMQVPNNANIIYVLFDNKTNYLISIDINGKLFTKTSHDITVDNEELITLLDRPVLRLYYDLNGYMLAIDDKFDLYQFTDIDWKTTPLQVKRGANSSKLHDILYDNDGKLYGLVFNSDAFMLQIMKQNEVFYLGDFYPLNTNLSSNKSNFVMSYQDIIKAKIGSLYDYLNSTINDDLETDDDPNFAFQKQIIETKGKLKQFCANRGSNTQNIQYDNYELLANVENNNDKIIKLKNIINNLMLYEPERMNIQDKYSILQK
jgi:hypothetical protein